MLFGKCMHENRTLWGIQPAVSSPRTTGRVVKNEGDSSVLFHYFPALSEKVSEIHPFYGRNDPESPRIIF
jgi:hypothetical protein